MVLLLIEIGSLNLVYYRLSSHGILSKELIFYNVAKLSFSPCFPPARWSVLYKVQAELFVHLTRHYQSCIDPS